MWPILQKEAARNRNLSPSCQSRAPETTRCTSFECPRSWIIWGSSTTCKRRCSASCTNLVVVQETCTPTSSAIFETKTQREGGSIICKRKKMTNAKSRGQCTNDDRTHKDKHKEIFIQVIQLIAHEYRRGYKQTLMQTPSFSELNPTFSMNLS